MITRELNVITFTATEDEIEILDFVEGRNQLFELGNIIQEFLDQRRRQREYDLKVDLRKLIGDTIASAEIDRIVQEFKDRQSNG